jgi:plasmid maintenance system antidote protein VapI
MAASIKISELNSLDNLTDVDLFLVSDMESTTSKKITYANLKSNLVDNLQTAVADLTGVVSQNNTTVTASLATLQADVDQNESDADAAIAALQATIDNLDIDIAPETLNSINELSAAMGDDPTFLTTLQNRLDVVEGDNATQTELDAVNQSLTLSLGTLSSDKLNVADPVFTGIISGPDIDINNGSLTVASSGGVVSNVGFFSSGMLSIGGAASFTGNATFSGGSFNLLNGLKISDVAVNATADELNYVVGVTSNIQTQIDSIQTTISNLDIDIAPETLNSIDELAAAMGDDPAFLTTLQSRVTTIENDNATQTELDAAVATLNTSITTGDSTVQANLDAYKAYVDEMNFQLMLAYDTPTYIDTLFGG